GDARPHAGCRPFNRRSPRKAVARSSIASVGPTGRRQLMSCPYCMEIIMFLKAPIGQFVWFKTPVPRRDAIGGLVSSIGLKPHYDFIDSAADREAAVLECLDKVLPLALRYGVE